MAATLYLSESHARAFPLPSLRGGISDLVDDYGDDGDERERAGGVEHVLLSPAPVHCELPRRGQDQRIGVWGYARCSLTVLGRRVATTSSAVGIHACATVAERPSITEALERTGIVWTSRRPARPDVLARAFCESAQVDADVQPRALNLRLLTASRAHDTTDALRSATAADRPAWLDRLPQTPTAWARVVLVNGAAPGPADGALKELALTLDGGEVALRARARLQRLGGSVEPYLMLEARGGSWDEAEATAIHDLLRRSLEHALAHHWLVARAEQLNDRLAECIDQLLDDDTSIARREGLQRYLGLLRYVFVNELELTWCYALDAPAGAEDACAMVDAAARITRRWERELTRFERLIAVAASVPAAGFAPQRPPIQLTGGIPGLSEERNPLKQVRAWWKHRGITKRRQERDHEPPEGAREIELHPFANRYALFEELNASIALTSFMTAASAVFLGVILQKRPHDPLPLDVLFLFISTFGFLFATLIYANGSGRLARHGTFGYEAQIEIANRVSEYLGVYPLLVSIPLSVSRSLERGPIPWAVAALALVAMVAYHYVRGASLLERDISNERVGSDRQRKYFYIPLLVLLMAATYAGELTGAGGVEVVGAIGFALLSLAIVLLSAMLPERTNPQKYRVDNWDVLGEETPSRYAGSLRDVLHVDDPRRRY